MPLKICNRQLRLDSFCGAAQIDIELFLLNNKDNVNVNGGIYDHQTLVIDTNDDKYLPQHFK